MTQLQSRSTPTHSKPSKAKKAKRDSEPPASTPATRRGRASTANKTPSIYDEYWRGKDRPHVSSLHKNLHIGVMSANAGRCATAMPWLQRALGYDVKGEPV